MNIGDTITYFDLDGEQKGVVTDYNYPKFIVHNEQKGVVIVDVDDVDYSDLLD